MLNIKFKGNFKNKTVDKKEIRGYKIEDRKKIINGSNISFIIILIGIILTILRFISSPPIKSHSVLELILWLFIGLILLFPIFLIHEFFHAICFPRHAEKEIWFFINKKSSYPLCFLTYCDSPITKKRFLFSVIFPNLILAMFPLLLWYIGLLDFNLFFSRIYGAILTILFCSGASDYKLFFNIILQVPNSAHVHMSNNSIYWY